MDLIRLIVIIALVAGVVWLIETYTKIDTSFKTLIRIVALVGCVLYALHYYGFI